jgi:hypothetical protein
MKTILCRLYVLLVFMLTVPAGLQSLRAQQNDHTGDADYYTEGRMSYEDRNYYPRIKSVQLYREGWVLSWPLINLNSAEKLVLSFDDLEGDVKNYRYTLIHCDAAWRKSPLLQQEYLSGFFEEDITDYKFSFNTLQRYTHYSLTFPTETMLPTLSGNYILSVYPDGKPEEPVLTRRFMIAEQRLGISGSVNRPVVSEYRNYRQEIDFVIDKSGYRIANPYRDLRVVVMQNSRWDNAITTLKPLYVKGDLLDYNYEEENVFNGGNEYRWFDIKSLGFISEYIERVYRDSAGFHVLLKPAQRKTFRVYISEKDINGRMFIKSDDNIIDSDIEAEYVYVHFSLAYDAPLAGGGVYIHGALSGWQFRPEAMMTYNYSLKAYEAVLYLKQGYYNYQYVYLENGSSRGDESLLEGTHYETENDYTILVYCRDEGSVFDKLIAVEFLNTYQRQ